MLREIDLAEASDEKAVYGQRYGKGRLRRPAADVVTAVKKWVNRWSWTLMMYSVWKKVWVRAFRNF